MSTRSSIALFRHDGKVEIIYCHYDGYTSFNGEILLRSYNTYEKVKRLLELGNLSVLADSPEKPAGHSFESKVKGHCVAYGRDRDEPDQQSRLFNSYREAVKYTGQEYNYIFKGGLWFVLAEKWVSQLEHFKWAGQKLLTPELCEQDF